MFDAVPVAIQIHIVAACAALLIGPFALYRRKRDRLHRCAGYLWIVAMAVAAIGSFWINGFAVIGPFSPIHALSAYALVTLATGLHAIRTGDRAGHERRFRGLYWHGLAVAGLFTFLPGRLLNGLLFGATPALGYGVIALGLAAIAAEAVIRRRGAGQSARGRDFSLEKRAAMD